MRVRSVLDPFRPWIFELGALPYAVLTAQPTWRVHGGELARLVGLEAGQRLLDLGCGPGVSAFGVLDRVPGAAVVGLDVSVAMIRLAKWLQRSEPRERQLEFVEGDAMRLPWPDASFDAVVGHSFLYLVPDADRVLAETARVLRPGGRCAFLEPAVSEVVFPRSLLRRVVHEPRFIISMGLWRVASRGYGRFDSARFTAAFRRAGLEPLEQEPTLDGMGLFGVARRPPASAEQRPASDADSRVKNASRAGVADGP